MISLVTITFNNFEELVDTLESVKDCDYIERVVINGGTCQKTIDLLSHQNFFSISEKDQGISDAFNKGIENSKGDSIAFLNSGDHCLDQNYYNQANNYLLEHPEVDFVYSDIIFVTINNEEIKVSPNDLDDGKMPFPHPSLVVRSSVFEKIGNFKLDYKVAMDFDFACRMIKNQFKGHYIPSQGVVKMFGNGISSTSGLKGIEERFRALKENELLSKKSYRYLKKMKFKNSLRALIGKLGLLPFYDSLKRKIYHTKAE
ncbi:MAG: glycosyltransferase [Halobacteriovoraceae bacterium]|nr:glycosyltransferase [Halobacteriovoraceae bacterium]